MATDQFTPPLIADAVEEAFAEELEAVVAAGDDAKVVPALPASALSAAILNAEGAIIWRQDRFAALVEPNAVDLPVASDTPAKSAVVLSHGRTRAGRAICLVVAPPHAATRWPITLNGDVLRAAGAGARVAVAVALSDHAEALATAARAFGFTPA